MNRVLRMTVATGPHKGEKYCVRGGSQCLMGRGPDCFVQFAGTERDNHISRHHCQLAFDPAALVVQDLGSMNGTYLDGKRIDRAELALDTLEWSEEINHCGNMLTIGGTTVRIDVVDCPSRQSLHGDQFVVWEEAEDAKKACPVPCC